MEKKNLQPQQQRPVMRPAVAKPIAGLSEEQLTAGWSGAAEAIMPSGCGGSLIKMNVF